MIASATRVFCAAVNTPGRTYELSLSVDGFGDCLPTIFQPPASLLPRLLPPGRFRLGYTAPSGYRRVCFQPMRQDLDGLRWSQLYIPLR